MRFSSLRPGACLAALLVLAGFGTGTGTDAADARTGPATNVTRARPEAGIEPQPYASAIVPTARTRIDEIVFARLAERGVSGAPICSDAVFLRRVFLDLLGTVPTAVEAREFLLDQRPDKRRALIGRLLDRDEYADYWAMRWGDVLRVKAEFPINLWPNAAQAYHRWIRTGLRENRPYDRFARELLTASGSNFRAPPVNFYRAVQSREPRALAGAVALTFMGTRSDRWPPERLDAMAVFFSHIAYKATGEWKEEIVQFDPVPASTNAFAPLRSPVPIDAVLPDGTRIVISPDRDPREAFADWLVQPGNPWFARAVVNRLWAWLLGRGIVHEPDDLRGDNPPFDPRLLAHLERELVASGWNLKQVLRLILESQTYQRASTPAPGSPTGPNGTPDPALAGFAHYPVRRLDAEVLIDAIDRITGGTEKYVSPISEPFTYLPDDCRAIAIPDGSIASPFLELFGRPPRDTGLESERSNRPSAAQRLHLLNSGHIARKIEQSRMLRYNADAARTPRDVANGLYLGILSRFPTGAEFRMVEDLLHPKPGAGAESARRRDAVADVIWALLNSPEFLHRH